MLRSFVKSAFELLKPGGRMVGINTSPFVTTRDAFASTHKYRLRYTTDNETCEEGDPLHIEIEGEDFLAKFDNYFWTSDSYQKAFEDCGFVNFRWVPLAVHSDDEEHWRAWKENCPLICFEAKKPEYHGSS